MQKNLLTMQTKNGIIGIKKEVLKIEIIIIAFLIWGSYVIGLKCGKA